MHDDLDLFRSPQRLWSDPGRSDGIPSHRIAHLVYLDGRLLDAWTEPVGESEWANQAAALDREQRQRLERLVRPLPAPDPPRPQPERALDWLADRCGGHEALRALDDLPLAALPGVPDDVGPAAVLERAGVVDALLTSVAERWPEPELDVALRRALVALCREEAHLLGGGRSPAVLAGGIAWVVLKANGVLRPAGEVRVQDLQDALALRSTPAPVGGLVRGALAAYQPRTGEQWRPASAPDLLDLGRPDLLTSVTRRALVQLRDRALAARDAVLPPTVESAGAHVEPQGS